MRFISPLTLSVLALAVAVGCSDEPAEPTAQIGAACEADDDCSSGWCLSESTFPGNYCSVLNCSADSPCPAGASCLQYTKEYAFCLASCSDVSSCRTGYVCEYQVCRPPCKKDGDCLNQDQCLSGICTSHCTTDAGCEKGKRCQDSKCLPPCKKDGDCLPGFGCDKGTCKAKMGAPMGKACSASAACATGYCLPTRRICSVTCSSTAGCPSAYVCGLEKLDKDGNGTPDGAQAACVPRKGKGGVTSNCARDADCASNHCYYGFCMEGCATSKDCGAHNCATVNLLVGGGIPQYKGCLPKQGTSQFELGTYKLSQTAGLDIPPGTSSFALTPRVNSTKAYPYIVQLKDPKGNLVSEVQSQCKQYAVPNRYSPDSQVNTLMVPNTPSVQVMPGLYTMMVGATDLSLTPTVTLQLKLGLAQKGKLNLNWYFLNISGTCVPKPALNKATAGSHKWFSKMRNNLQTILGSAGITVGTETFNDLKNPALDVIDLSENSAAELYSLFASSKGVKGKAINIFLVREIKSGSMGGTVLGYAGGIPGPPGIHGTVHSGVTMSMIGVCYENLGYNPSHTLAHELGHYLGLWHNIERETLPGWDEVKQDVACPCPCGPNMSCYKETSRYGFQWCRGQDPIPDSDTKPDNLMYWAAESTQMFKGNKLSKGQIRAILNNPLVGH